MFRNKAASLVSECERGFCTLVQMVFVEISVNAEWPRQFLLNCLGSNGTRGDVGAERGESSSGSLSALNAVGGWCLRRVHLGRTDACQDRS